MRHGRTGMGKFATSRDGEWQEHDKAEAAQAARRLSRLECQSGVVLWRCFDVADRPLRGTDAFFQFLLATIGGVSSAGSGGESGAALYMRADGL